MVLKKDVGLSLSRIDRSIYGLLHKGLTHRAFTTSSVGAGKQYWDDVIRYLKGEVKIDALPTVIREPANDIRLLIDKLSKQIKPYVKSEEIKKVTSYFSCGHIKVNMLCYNFLVFEFCFIKTMIPPLRIILVIRVKDHSLKKDWLSRRIIVMV